MDVDEPRAPEGAKASKASDAPDWVVAAGDRGLRFVGMKRSVFVARVRHILVCENQGRAAQDALQSILDDLQAGDWIAHFQTRARQPPNASTAAVLPAAELLSRLDRLQVSVRSRLRHILANKGFNSGLAHRGQICHAYVGWLDRVAEADDIVQGTLRQLIDRCHASFLDSGLAAKLGRLPAYATVCAEPHIADGRSECTLRVSPSLCAETDAGPGQARTEPPRGKPWVQFEHHFDLYLPEHPRADVRGLAAAGEVQLRSVREAVKLLALLHLPDQFAMQRRAVPIEQSEDSSRGEEVGGSVQLSDLVLGGPVPNCESPMSGVINHWTGALFGQCQPLGPEPALPTLMRLRLPKAMGHQRLPQSEIVSRIDRATVNVRALGYWVLGISLEGHIGTARKYEKQHEEIRDLGFRMLAVSAILRTLIGKDPRLRCEQCFRAVAPGNRRFCSLHTRQHVPEVDDAGKSLLTMYLQSKLLVGPLYRRRVEELRPAMSGPLALLAQRADWAKVAVLRRVEGGIEAATINQWVAQAKARVDALQGIVNFVAPLISEPDGRRLQVLFIRRVKVFDLAIFDAEAARCKLDLAWGATREKRLSPPSRLQPPGSKNAFRHATGIIPDELFPLHAALWQTVGTLTRAAIDLHPEVYFGDFFALDRIDDDQPDINTPLDRHHPYALAVLRRDGREPGFQLSHRTFSHEDLCEDLLHLIAWYQAGGQDVDVRLGAKQAPLGSRRRAAGGGTRPGPAGIDAAQVLMLLGVDQADPRGLIPKGGPGYRRIAADLRCSVAWISKLVKQWRQDQALKAASAGTTVGATRKASVAPHRVAKPAHRKSVKAPAKYEDEFGNSWTGRGLKPRWLVLRLALDKTKGLEDFRVAGSQVRP